MNLVSSLSRLSHRFKQNLLHQSLLMMQNTSPNSMWQQYQQRCSITESRVIPFTPIPLVQAKPSPSVLANDAKYKPKFHVATLPSLLIMREIAEIQRTSMRFSNKSVGFVFMELPRIHTHFKNFMQQSRCVWICVSRTACKNRSVIAKVWSKVCLKKIDFPCTSEFSINRIFWLVEYSKCWKYPTWRKNPVCRIFQELEISHVPANSGWWDISSSQKIRHARKFRYVDYFKTLKYSTGLKILLYRIFQDPRIF